MPDIVRDHARAGGAHLTHPPVADRWPKALRRTARAKRHRSAADEMRTDIPTGTGPSQTADVNGPDRLGRRATLAALSARIERLQQHYHPRRSLWPSGLSVLDAALGGGFARGSVHELIGPDEAPLRMLALRLAARVLATGLPRAPAESEKQASPTGVWGVYIDSTGDFYPPSAARIGVPLGRLVVLRVRRAVDAFWACEQALRCRAVGVVVFPIRRLESTQSRRLQLAAEVGGGLGFLLRPDEAASPTFSATRLRIEPVAPRLENPSDDDWFAWQLRLTCLKRREGPAGREFVLTLADGSVSMADI